MWDNMDDYFYSSSDTKWLKMFMYAQEYSKEHGGKLDMPCNFKVIGKNNEIIKLGQWVAKQRYSCAPNSKRGQLLSLIGMNFERKIYLSQWKEMYELAKQFYEKNGHLNIPLGFVTTDDYDKPGKELGKWVSRQRFRKEISSDEIYLLNCIGMIWNISHNNNGLAMLCYEKGIDVEKNYSILKHKSLVEVKIKMNFIDYLKKENGIDIDYVDENGILHEIFSMSSMNMKLKYGVSLEDLVNMYGKEKSK